MKKGVYLAKKKNGDVYYRASITYAGKHVSLGSFETEDEASYAYIVASKLYSDKTIDILNASEMNFPLSFDKTVTILNHRDNGIYIKTPIYLHQGYFSYYLKGLGELKFDNDDLFYHSSHRIHFRNGHLYVNDFGMQYGILARYGIKNYAVCGRDYRFANGDDLDFRYQNVIVINNYHGVFKVEKRGQVFYESKIHLNGDFLVGRFQKECVAAVAYNKAADFARDRGFEKNFPHNFVVELSVEDYGKIYDGINLPQRFVEFFKSDLT